MVVWSGYGDSYRNILHVCYLFIDVRLFITPRPSKGLEYCDERVCLSVCLSVCPRAYFKYKMPKFHKKNSARCLRFVFLYWRCDTLRISGFMDDAIVPAFGQANATRLSRELAYI